MRRVSFLASAIIGLCGLGISQPVAAQNLTYNLFGVTFNDGAVASGYFNFDPTADQFGTYDITTTNGVSDTLPGQHFSSSLQNPGSALFLGVQGFLVYTPSGDLFLEPAGATPSTSGMFPLAVGVVDPSGRGLDSGSGEFHFDSQQSIMVRSVASGSLFVTSAAVPEASTTVSFGLLLALGLSGVVIARKKARA